MLFRNGMTERTRPYRALQAIARGLFASLADFRVQGLDNYPAQGPYIVVINHLHWLDLPQVFSTLPHVVAGVMNRKWERHPIAGPIARHVGQAIPIDPGRPDPRGIARARRWLEDGGCILIAPEGTRSRSGVLKEGLRGAAYLSNRAAAPMIPVAMWGQERVGTAWKSLRKPTVSLAVGAPIDFPWTSRRAATAELDDCTHLVMATLASMLPPAYRGAYAEAVGRGSADRAVEDVSQTLPPAATA